MTLPAEVLTVCTTWLAAIDGRAPGLVTGLHLRGGLCFGEWVPGQSDIDFTAVLAHRPDMGEIAALESAHQLVALRHPRPFFDGMHVLAADLAAPPADCPDVPCVLEHSFAAAARNDLCPVSWHELADRGIAIRGELPSMWTDDVELETFTRANLDSYWREQAERLTAAVDEIGDLEWLTAWCVLGVARLDHLLVTGALTTKSGAGRWALRHYPERFHPVLCEALRIRQGGPGPGEYVAARHLRARDTADFTSYVVDLPR